MDLSSKKAAVGRFNPGFSREQREHGKQPSGRWVSSLTEARASRSEREDVAGATESCFLGAGAIVRAFASAGGAKTAKQAKIATKTSIYGRYHRAYTQSQQGYFLHSQVRAANHKGVL